MNGKSLHDKHLMVALFVLLVGLIVLAANLSPSGWVKVLDWSLDKAAIVLGGITTLVVQRLMNRSTDGQPPSSPDKSNGPSRP